MTCVKLAKNIPERYVIRPRRSGSYSTVTVDPMARPLHLLTNLGAVSARRLTEAGIADDAALRALGPVAAYRRVKHAFPRQTSLNLLYALEGALTETHWQRIPERRKAQLRREAETGQP